MTDQDPADQGRAHDLRAHDLRAGVQELGRAHDLRAGVHDLRAGAHDLRAGVHRAGVHDLRAGARLLAAPVTVVLIGLCVLAFVATLGMCATAVDAPGAMLAGSWWKLEGCGGTLTNLGALRLSNLWLDGSWWRVVTAGLLHGSWIHLVLNTWSLWVVGEWTEATWGHTRTAILFVISSVAGCLASAAWVEAPMVVGASAGIMGMAGALFVGRLLGRGSVGVQLRPLSAKVLGIWLGVLVALGFFVDMIAQAGHLGGLAAGALLGLAWSGRGPAISLSGRMALGMLFAGLVLVARQPRDRLHYDEYLGYAYQERGLDQEAMAAFERALARRPDDSSLANAVAYGWAKEGQQLDRAEQLVRRALEVEPDNADYIDTLGWVLCRRGDVEAGMVELRRASTISEGTIEEIEGHLETCPTAAAP